MTRPLDPNTDAGRDAARELTAWLARVELAIEARRAARAATQPAQTKEASTAA